MRLNIYIANHCFNCQQALDIAEQARKIAHLEVAVINLDDANQAVPSKVVAVPTYLLDGRIVSLGNPDREAFLGELERIAGGNPR